MRQADKANLIKLVNNSPHCDLVNKCRPIVEAIECEPEPLEFWVNCYDGRDERCGGVFYNTKTEAEIGSDKSITAKQILMRQVTDEQTNKGQGMIDFNKPDKTDPIPDFVYVAVIIGVMVFGVFYA